MESSFPNTSTRRSSARQFWLVAALFIAVYFVLPNLRLPGIVLESAQLLFAGIGVVYFLLGLAGRNPALLGDFPRTFCAIAGAVFLFLNYTFVSLWLISPLAVPPSELPSARVGVVLGGGLHSSGMLSEESVRRVVRGVQIYHQGLVSSLQFSSGLRAPDGNSEAMAMALVARTLRVPERAILLEERSRNTWENARYSGLLLASLQVDRVLLVTDPLHMRRARDTFLRHGIQVHPAPTTDLRRLFKLIGGWNILLRGAHEYLGIIYYRYFKRKSR